MAFSTGGLVRIPISSVSDAAALAAKTDVFEGDLVYQEDTQKWYYYNGTGFDVISASLPIGTIQSYLKSYPNTPALDASWVECNGQVLSDASSVYNGQTIPNLNGNNYFLRGSATSGTSGGNATHSHAMNSTIGTTAANGYLQWDLVDGGGSDKRYYDSNGAEVTGALSTSTDLYTAKVNNEPPYYEVVFIMKIK